MRIFWGGVGAPPRGCSIRGHLLMFLELIAGKDRRKGLVFVDHGDHDAHVDVDTYMKTIKNHMDRICTIRVCGFTAEQVALTHRKLFGALINPNTLPW